MGLLKQNCNVCERHLKNIRSQLKGVGPICEDRFAKCRCPLEPFGWNYETNSPRGFSKPWWDYDVVNGWLAPLCKRCKGYHFPEGLGTAPKVPLTGWLEN